MTRVLIGIGIVIVALLIFQAGIFVGYHKAGFSYRWGENYFRTFGKPRGGFMGMGMMENRFPSANGISGKIIKVNLPSIVIEEQANVERVAVITSGTIIRKFREEIKPQDLKVGDSVVVVGSPDNNAQIEAKLIRIIPPPPQNKAER